jgi:1,4-alpha-glucan branching enzyme
LYCRLESEHAVDLFVFSAEFPPHLLGGLGTHVQYMTAALRRYFDVHVFVPGRDDYSPKHGVRLEEIPVDEEGDSIEFWLEYAHRAAKRVKLSISRPAVLQCHDWSTALAGVAARRLMRTPLIFNVHLPQRGDGALAMENMGLMAADLVIVNSRSVRDEIASRSLPVRRIEIVPNGVDLDLFHPANAWPTHGGYVLFAGRLVPQKGVEVLVRALAVLLYRFNCSLVIAGDGPLELYLQRLARYSGIPDHVSFRGWQSGSALIELFQNAAVVAVPSIYEPFGIVALETMACARVCVASRVGGLAEIIESGVDGYLTEPGDYLDLARHLFALLSDTDLLCSMGEAARRKAECYSWEVAATATVRLFRELHYSGEDWSMTPEARSATQQLYKMVDSSHCTLLAETLGTGVNA